MSVGKFRFYLRLEGDFESQMKPKSTVWLRKTEAFLALRDELIGLAADEPDDVSEHEDMVDFYWRFDSFSKAETVAAALTSFRQRAEFVLLRLSNCDDPQSSFTFNDARYVGH